MLKALDDEMPAIWPMSRWPTTLLGGLPVARVSMAEAADGIVAHVLAVRGRRQRPFYSTSANGQVIALCAEDETYVDLMNEADQIHADGMPMVLFSKIYSKRPLIERVATTDLVHAVAERAQDAGISFYFLGSTEEDNSRAVEAMRLAYPRLTFAGRRNGYFKPEDEAAIIRDIQAAKPDILWIGLGFPVEQQFVRRNIEQLHGIGLIKTSGGLFDFLSGRNRRAPVWMQRIGFEWAYRIYMEPKRLMMRYLVTNPAAIHALLRHSN